MSEIIVVSILLFTLIVTNLIVVLADRQTSIPDR